MHTKTKTNTELPQTMRVHKTINQQQQCPDTGMQNGNKASLSTSPASQKQAHNS